MNERDEFFHAVEDFGTAAGMVVETDGNHAEIALADDLLANLEFLENSGMVVLWATVGFLPEDGLAGARAAALLEMNDLGLETAGFSLGMDSDDRRLIAHDRRPAEAVSGPDPLAAWIDDLADVAGRIRTRMRDEFPSEGV